MIKGFWGDISDDDLEVFDWIKGISTMKTEEDNKQVNKSSQFLSKSKPRELRANKHKNKNTKDIIENNDDDLSIPNMKLKNDDIKDILLAKPLLPIPVLTVRKTGYASKTNSIRNSIIDSKLVARNVVTSNNNSIVANKDTITNDKLCTDTTNNNQLTKAGIVSIKPVLSISTVCDDEQNKHALLYSATQHLNSNSNSMNQSSPNSWITSGIFKLTHTIPRVATTHNDIKLQKTTNDDRMKYYDSYNPSNNSSTTNKLHQLLHNRLSLDGGNSSTTNKLHQLRHNRLSLDGGNSSTTDKLQQLHHNRLSLDGGHSSSTVVLRENKTQPINTLSGKKRSNTAIEDYQNNADTLACVKNELYVRNNSHSKKDSNNNKDNFDNRSVDSNETQPMDSFPTTTDNKNNNNDNNNEMRKKQKLNSNDNINHVSIDQHEEYMNRLKSEEEILKLKLHLKKEETKSLLTMKLFEQGKSKDEIKSYLMDLNYY